DLPGIVVDDTQAKKVGLWKHSTFSGNYVGKGYLYDDRGMKGEKTVTFIPDFAKTGLYEVRLTYVPHTNRASNVPVRIFHADGDVTVTVNQRQTPPIDGRWLSLGRYRFEQGMQWFVMVSTDGANGYVVADAVQFLPDDLPQRGPVGSRSPTATPADGKTPDSRALDNELKRLLADAPY